MIRWLDRYFEIESRGSTLRRELLAGTTTWVTLAYIVPGEPGGPRGRRHGCRGR